MTILVRFHHISDLRTMTSGRVININPFFQDNHTQMTQTAKGNITEITKFALVRPAMHPR